MKRWEWHRLPKATLENTFAGCPGLGPPAPPLKSEGFPHRGRAAPFQQFCSDCRDATALLKLQGHFPAHGAAPGLCTGTTRTPGRRLTRWHPSREHPLAAPVPTGSATSSAVGILSTGMPFPSAQVLLPAGFPQCRSPSQIRGSALSKSPWVLKNMKTDKNAQQPPSS